MPGSAGPYRPGCGTARCWPGTPARDDWSVDGANRKRRRMRLSWLYPAGELVHRPSSGALGRRRPNRPPQPGAAVRSPPSGGPSSRMGRHPRRGRSPRVRPPALDRSRSNPATQHSASIYPRPMTGRCTMPRLCWSTPTSPPQARAHGLANRHENPTFGVERVFNGYCVVTHCSWPANFESIRSRRSRRFEARLPPSGRAASHYEGWTWQASERASGSRCSRRSAC
jgi:hypothetical protein